MLKKCLCLSLIANEDFGKVRPFFQGAYQGDNVEITCFSSFKPTWKKDGNRLPKRIKRSTNCIHINDTYEVDNGIYTCYGTYPDGSGFVEKSTLFVGGIIFSIISCFEVLFNQLLL